MAKKREPPDFNIHDLADRNRAHSHQMYRGAFRITPQSLREFQAMFDAAAGAPIKSTWLVLTASDEPKTFETLDDVLALRNPQGNPIWGLFFNHVGKDVKCRLFVTSADIKQFAAIQFSADGESPDKVSSLIGRVHDETKNIRLWYWPFRWIDDYLIFLARRYGKTIAMVLLAVCLSALAVGAIGQAIMSLSHSVDSAQRPAATKPSESATRPAPQLTEEERIALEAEIRKLKEEARERVREQQERERYCQELCMTPDQAATLSCLIPSANTMPPIKS